MIKKLSIFIFVNIFYFNLHANETIRNDGQRDRLNTINGDVGNVGSLLIDPNRISTLSDGGWSSSGGGEFLINKNNPWFLGDKEVSWCINHGGPSNFSLPLEESKKMEKWMDEATTEQSNTFINKHPDLPIIDYKQGDLAVYTGGENYHGTLPITGGERYILTFFFS